MVVEQALSEWKQLAALAHAFVVLHKSAAVMSGGVLMLEEPLPAEEGLLACAPIIGRSHVNRKLPSLEADV